MSVDTTAERLAAFFDHSPDAILVVASDGTIRRANARVEDVFGYAPEELEGELVEVLVPDAAAVDHPEKREAYFEDPESRPMGAGLELRAEHRDGTTFPVDVSLSPIQTGGDTEVIAAVRDRSKRERLQRKYRTVMQTAPDATFIIDAGTGEILEVNQAATDLLEAPTSRIVGAHMTMLHPSEEPQRYRELFHAHPEGEQKTVARFENGDDVLVETTDGEHVPVEISAQHLELGGEDVLVAMFRDVSERRQYERDLYHQIDRLERLAEVLSHDLRNPLNVAEGNLELALDDDDTSRLQDVERAHDRMRDIIEDALTMVRGGAEVESVDPLELSGIAWKCWRNVPTANASLDVDANGLVYADETRTSHLFENLFRNAVEHGSTSPDSQARQDAVEHGSTSPRSQAHEDAVEHAGGDVAVTVGVLEGGFFVADDGPGIPPEQRASVTESGWTTSSTGSGLGLSIVADIAAAHDWTLTVTESSSGGARFEFTDVRAAPYDDAYEQAGERPDRGSDSDT